jgi:iron complex transport system substrate-binding protein
LFLLSVSSGAPLAAGQGTSAHSMIELAGGRNVTADFKGYKGVGPEAIIAAAPEFIIITQRTLDRYGGIDRILQLPDVKATPAARNGRVISFDDMYLLGFGPRAVQAVRELAERLHGLPLHADRGVVN